MRRPGVLGSSMVSASGGLAVPSTLSERALARRAVMASRLGMFLYPLGILPSFFWSVSLLSRSSRSDVSCSPWPASLWPGVVARLPGGDVARLAGEAERDPGGFTATESEVDAAAELDTEPCELVRRRAAARRGREAADAGLVFALRLMRAASWFSEGMREPVEGLSGLGASSGSEGCAAGVDIVAVEEDVEDSVCSHCLSSHPRFGHIGH